MIIKALSLILAAVIALTGFSAVNGHATEHHDYFYDEYDFGTCTSVVTIFDYISDFIRSILDRIDAFFALFLE